MHEFERGRHVPVLYFITLNTASFFEYIFVVEDHTVIITKCRKCQIKGDNVSANTINDDKDKMKTLKTATEAMKL